MNKVVPGAFWSSPHHSAGLKVHQYSPPRACALPAAGDRDFMWHSITHRAFFYCPAVSFRDLFNAYIFFVYIHKQSYSQCKVYISSENNVQTITNIQLDIKCIFRFLYKNPSIHSLSMPLILCNTMGVLVELTAQGRVHHGWRANPLQGVRGRNVHPQSPEVRFNPSTQEERCDQCCLYTVRVNTAIKQQV